MMYWNEKHAECICQDCILRGSLKERYSTHTKDYSVGSIQHVYGSSAMKANLLYHTLYLPPWSFCITVWFPWFFMLCLLHGYCLCHHMGWDVDASHWLFNTALNYQSRWRHKISLLYWKHLNAYVQIRSEHPGWWESGFFCSRWQPGLRSSKSTTSFTNVSPWLFASNKHQVMCQVTYQNRDISRMFFPSHLDELGDLEVISDCCNVAF